MTKSMLFAFAAATMFGTSAFAQDAARPSGSGGSPRILIAFFSKTGNTGTIAELIRGAVGGDLFHVATQAPYPDDYRETTRIARVELDRNTRPALARTLQAETMKGYDIIFLGYPNWWGTIPMAMFTFLEQYDLSGKTIVPFCTHEGSGLGQGPADIAKLAPNAIVAQGLAIRGSASGRAQNDVVNWLRRLGYIR